MESFILFAHGATQFPVLALAFSPAIVLVLFLAYSVNVRFSNPSKHYSDAPLVQLPNRPDSYVYLNAESRQLVFSDTPLPAVQKKQPAKGANKLHAVLRAYHPPFEDVVEEYEV